MYVKRIQIVNYGPIERLDISLPFDEDKPKPVLLIGENGSGKSIVLSHIVNALLQAKDRVFPDSTEVEPNKVFKLRSSSYIRVGCDLYFARVDFEDGLYMSEIRSLRNKENYKGLPIGIPTSHMEEAWDELPGDSNDHMLTNMGSGGVFQTPEEQRQEAKIRSVFSQNCVLYFPPNRFEEPAWLNEGNLLAHADFMRPKRLQGHTERRIINEASLQANVNWLFEVVYDTVVFEMQRGRVGGATNSYNAALSIYQTVLREKQDVSFGIGTRRDRVVSVNSGGRRLVPNIFQLSTGETALLNLFFSILRDFELSGSSFSSTQDVRGIVVVDEIDLHLHVSHQYSILPNLIKMFPKVQFIVTTHSPLFILGMRNVFGDGGFALYRMPGGDELGPEEFSEFGDAYQVFEDTRKHVQEIRSAQAEVNKPIVIVEGYLDHTYIAKSAELLGMEATLNKITLRPDKSSSGLDKIWNAPELSGTLPVKVGLLYDCDTGRPDESKGSFSRRTLPLQDSHPIKRGIENLFSRETLEKALAHKSAFVDITEAHSLTDRGELKEVPETWTVNKHEKKNLCDWLCENGTAEDFQSFEIVFEMIEAMLSDSEETNVNPVH